MVGILSYATYIPQYRITIDEIASVWGKNPQDIKSSLKIKEKAVAGADEDAATLAVEAAAGALASLDSKKQEIDLVYVGSESHPYAVNPTATIVGEMLGLGNLYQAADFEFACKAATAAIFAAAGLVEAEKCQKALVIGADRAQSRPHASLEYTAAAGAAAFVIGKGKKIITEIKETTSFSSDTPDFWRRDGTRYPSHGGRFTGKPAYFRHVKNTARSLLEKSGKKPEDFTYCVFHMPNGKFPRRAAKQLGFTKKQLKPSLTVDSIGNPYAAAALLGLASVLDEAPPGALIFMVSYGSGAGADGFILEVKDEIVSFRKRQRETVISQIKNKKYINYVEYLKMTNKI